MRQISKSSCINLFPTNFACRAALIERIITPNAQLEELMDKQELEQRVAEAKERLQKAKELGLDYNEYQNMPKEAYKSKTAYTSERGRVRAEMSGFVEPRPTPNYLNTPTTLRDLPKTADESLREDWEEQMIRCAENGGSQKAIMLAIGVTTATRYNYLLANDPYFKEVHQRCILIAEVRWEEMGIDLTRGNLKNGSSHAWAFSMKNRYNWKEKTETEVTEKTQGDVKINVNFLNSTKAPNTTYKHPSQLTINQEPERLLEDGSER